MWSEPTRAPTETNGSYHFTETFMPDLNPGASRNRWLQPTRISRLWNGTWVTGGHFCRARILAWQPIRSQAMASKTILFSGDERYESAIRHQHNGFLNNGGFLGILPLSFLHTKALISRFWRKLRETGNAFFIVGCLRVDVFRRHVCPGLRIPSNAFG